MAKAGKIDLHFFKRNIRGFCGFERAEILQGPAFGVDISVVAIDAHKALIAASDPMSFIPAIGAKASAWLSVVLTANDIFTSGWAPQWAQIVLNLPDTMRSETFQNYWQYLHRFCREQKIGITGGHTGFVPEQTSTFIGGITLFSIVPQNKIFTSDKARERDVIIMTNYAAMLSTAILALSFPQTVKKQLGYDVYAQCEKKFYQTSVKKEAFLSAGCIGVSAMHDVTEGGIIGAVYEMMRASGKGFEITKEKILTDDATRKMSQLFGYDAAQSVGAGSLIITIHPENAGKLKEILRANNIACSAIGTVQAPDFGCKIRDGNKISEYQPLEKDTYWAAFYKALNEGWQ